MPYIFLDDGAPEASDYDSNYVFVDDDELRRATPRWQHAWWRRVSGWWCAHPAETARHN